ncbi:Metallo-dependent phosphatase-like protein [Gigaspora rosea]|uniref:Metallo-dependent phosphatase-like protein n=1 Tax=Gigaspora rosea TaxID=44941 RepID=A0A397V7Q9_9GLOM|nr:Metallo-dependent phosphatase-like protein [Gigaspora rosea]
MLRAPLMFISLMTMYMSIATFLVIGLSSIFKNSLITNTFAQKVNTSITYPEVNASITTPYPKAFEETYADSILDFIVLGDWGFNRKGTGEKHGDQVHVAFAMDSWAKRYNTNFIINVGDSFYKNSKSDHQGVESVDDPKWKTNWIDVYKGKLSEMPWYSVAGNHDWYNNVTAQVDYYWSKNNRFFLPSLFYVRISVFGPEKTKVAWLHIDTNIFYYKYEDLTNKNLLKSNLQNFDVHTSKAIESKLKWIEENLALQKDAKWIFVVGHHPLIGDCVKYQHMSRLLSLFEMYRVTAYFAGHSHVLEYQYPKPSSPVAIFTSGAGSRSSSGCPGKDWGMPVGTLGFLHVKIESNSDEMSFEFVDATTYKAKVVFQGKVNSTSIWYPKAK